MRASACISRHRIALGVVIVFLTAPAWAYDSPRERVTLQRLTAFTVLAQVNPDDKIDGLTRQQLQTDVELRLRKAGITVSSPSDQAFLFLQLQILKATNSLYAVYYKLEFNQGVSLSRDSSITTVASTWFVDGAALLGSRNLSEMRDVVADMVDQFINAYLEQNPKP